MPSVTYLWSKILAHIEEHHTRAMVETWFDDVDVVELRDDGTLVLFTPNPFRKPILENQCMPYINEAVLAVAQQRVNVLILDQEGLKKYRNQANQTGELDAIQNQFTFDNFVVGSANRFAHAAAQAVAAHPAESYNPLLIYGESGLGKTHLLYAIAGEIRKNHPEFHIVYVKGDQFTNELIEAIREGKNTQFRSKYRTADLFLMDDIQFIAGRESTQEEFFHTFNTLFEAKKQIVLTSDRAPDVMSKLEDRLKTRFQWGLLADIQPPDYETRVAIVEKKAAASGLQLPPDVVNYVAENVTSNVRQLEGTVNKIRAYRDVSGMRIDVTSVSRAIKDMFKGSERILPTPGLIITEVASYYNLDESAIRGAGRMKNTLEARQVSMYIIRQLTNLSFEDIAAEFGKDHSTVIHAVTKIDTAVSTGGPIKATVDEIIASVNGKLG